MGAQSAAIYSISYVIILLNYKLFLNPCSIESQACWRQKKANCVDILNVWIPCKKISLALMNKCRRKKRQQPNPISTEQRDDILHANYQIESLEALHTQRTHKLVLAKWTVNMEKAKNVKNVWAHSVWAANLHNISSRFHVLRLNISVALNFTAIYTWQFYLDWMAFLQVYSEFRSFI